MTQQPPPFIGPVPPEVVQHIRSGLMRATPMEAHCLLALLTGQTNNGIALRLGRSKRTIELHIQALINKCASTREQIIRVCCVELAADNALTEHVTELTLAYRIKSRDLGR